MRGGTGIFTGRPAYVWISNQIGNTGVLTGFEELNNINTRPWNPNPDAYKPADVTGAPFRNPFDSVSMCIMEMFDKATFAQVPVELTGDPAMPVRVRPDADGDYKVGTSPVWRLGKKMLGFSVPMRFAAGEPFHAGKSWQGMEIGIKAMSSMLAD